MKKLTREEIQALNDVELTLYLMYYSDKPAFDRYVVAAAACFKDDLQNHPQHKDYCNSLDAQFELAEKFRISLRAWGPEEPDEKLSMGAWKGNKYFCSLDKNKGTKRTGAEALLMAIQELEVMG